MTHHTPRWWSWPVALGIAWGLLFVSLAAVAEPTPANLTLAASIWSAGLYTAALRATRRWWLPRLKKNALRNAVVLSTLNAALVEAEFLIFERLFGAGGIAAHPNLIVDLILMMPWYTMMALAFVKVQHRWRFSPATVLFLGGIYELGADGIVGPLMGVFVGSYELFTPDYWLTIALSAFWGFMTVYSSMVLPPVWLVDTIEAPSSPGAPVRRAALAALKPLLWLIPYGVYLSVIMVMVYS